MNDIKFIATAIHIESFEIVKLSAQQYDDMTDCAFSIIDRYRFCDKASKVEYLENDFCDAIVREINCIENRPNRTFNELDTNTRILITNFIDYLISIID